jgi:hypothetical protein
VAVLKRVRLVGLVVGSALLLSACGSGGALTDARRACHRVGQAIALEKKSQAPGLSAAQVAQLTGQAEATLLHASSDAANATSQDGQWNALMTTINEAERVPLAQLEPALTNICKVANSSSPYF